jgi:hypothetical protein
LEVLSDREIVKRSAGPVHSRRLAKIFFLTYLFSFWEKYQELGN